MINLRTVLATLIISLPATAFAAEITVDGLPDDTVWYMHADLEAMRSSDSGSPIYEWFEGEVVVEINEELGIDLNAELDSVTAFADSSNGAIIVVQGPISKETSRIKCWPWPFWNLRSTLAHIMARSTTS